MKYIFESLVILKENIYAAITATPGTEQAQAREPRLPSSDDSSRKQMFAIIKSNNLRLNTGFAGTDVVAKRKIAGNSTGTSHRHNIACR